MVSLLGTWGAEKPYYQLNANAVLIEEGIYAAQFPIRAANTRLLAQPYFFKLFQIDFPVLFEGSEKKIVVNILKKMQQVSLEKLA